MVRADKYIRNTYFADTQTKLIIPNAVIAVTNAATSVISSLTVNPTETADNLFTKTIPRLANGDYTTIIEGIINSLILGLGVTKIETNQEYVMPFSKGIGSTGEVIHLLGARNEIINLEFKTEKYPGRLGFLIRTIIQKVLETAQVVYLIDDLFLATPCLLRKIKLSKEGSFRGAVMGELELVSLATGSNFIKDRLGNSKNIQNLVTQLKSTGRTSGNPSSFSRSSGLVIGGMSALFIGKLLGFGGL